MRRALAPTPIRSALLTLSVLALDQVTKHVAQLWLAGRGPLVVIENAIDLRYAQNHGLAFSMLGGRAIDIALLVALTAAVTFLVLLGWQRLPHKRPVEHAGFAVMLAGVLGNLLDRTLRGYVIDFVHFSDGPIFNVADFAVFTGVGLLLLAPMRYRPPRR